MWKFSTILFISFVNIKIIRSCERFSLELVKEYNIRNCDEIKSFGFESWYSIEKIGANGNRIKVLKNDTYIGGNDIKIINLENNLISAIQIEAFRNLHKLEELNLNRNDLKELKSGIFDSLENLKIISISHSKLSVLENNLLQFNKQIWKIVSNNNKVIAVGPNLFEILHITYLCYDAYIGLEELEKTAVLFENESRTQNFTKIRKIKRTNLSTVSTIEQSSFYIAAIFKCILWIIFTIILMQKY